MNVIGLVKNQFLGINPHLHSYYQAEGGWEGFHSNHLVDMTRALRAQLFPIGYTAEIEESLQIRRTGEDVIAPESDVTIYDTQPHRAALSSVPYQGDTHQLVMELPKTIARIDPDAAPFRAIAVYQQPRQDRIPVAWIELLSPANKPKGRHSSDYQYKRTKLLDSGLIVVELDYLHESSPTILRLADYRKKEQGSHPYRIIVFDPHPIYLKGKTYVSQFDVDAAIPTVTIPLSGSDKLDFDFNAPYQKTFEEMLYGLQLVDYSTLPANFDRYSQDDQAQIFTRLLSVKAGEDQTPAPLDPLPYEEAAAQWGSR